MENLHIYCRRPKYVRHSKISSGAIEGLKMPRSRHECTNAVYTAKKHGLLVPWKPYNFTEPLIDGEYSGNEEHLVDCIETATVTYGEVDQPGVFKAKLHPRGFYPAEGMYITAFWVENGDGSGVSGKLVFYGRVTKVKRGDGAIDVTAEDVLATLNDKDQLAVHGVTAETGIYRMALLAGAYMYRETAYPDEAEREPQLIVQNKAYGRYQAGVTDLLDYWYMVTGYRQYIKDVGGIIVLCSYDNPDDVDIIDKSMVGGTWEFEESDDTTYTRVTISYPVITITGGTASTQQTHHLGESENSVRFREYHTFEGTAASLEEANIIANQILQYHSFPQYRLTMQKVAGILRLRPGMLVGVPYIFEEENTQYMALCVIRSVTHTFANEAHTMDLTLELDPFDWDPKALRERNMLERDAWWEKKFTVVVGDYSRGMKIRMPLWLKNSMTSVKQSFSQHPILTKYWDVLKEMQDSISVLYDTPEFQFWRIQPNVTGVVGMYKGLPVIIPNLPNVHHMDDRTQAIVRDPRQADNAMAVVVRHENKYDCYMVSHLYPTPEAAAGIYIGNVRRPIIADGIYTIGHYTMARFAALSRVVEIPIKAEQTEYGVPGTKVSGFYTDFYQFVGDRIKKRHIVYKYLTNGEVTVRDEWADTYTDAGPYEIPYEEINTGTGGNLLFTGSKVVLVKHRHTVRTPWSGGSLNTETEYGGAILPYEA